MYLDVMVSDASKPVWRNAALFDAIITDRMSQIYCYYTHTHTLGLTIMKTRDPCVDRCGVIPAVFCCGHFQLVSCLFSQIRNHVLVYKHEA